LTDDLQFELETLEKEYLAVADRCQVEREFMERVLKARSLRAYEHGLRDFATWCSTHRLAMLPATVSTLTTYFLDRRTTLTQASMEQRLMAISRAHRIAGLDSPTADPTFRDTIDAVRRESRHSSARKYAFFTEDITNMLRNLLESVDGIRDRALLSIGFRLRLGAAELVSIDIEDILVSGYGITIVLRHSRTDRATSDPTEPWNTYFSSLLDR
jgi:site-specific recombinase XerD